MAELRCIACGNSEQVPDAYILRNCVCPRCREPVLCLPAMSTRNSAGRTVLALGLVTGLLFAAVVVLVLAHSGSHSALEADPPKRDWTPPSTSPGGWDGSGTVDAKLMEAAQLALAEVVREALRNGANANAVFAGGLAPLHMAANSAYPGRTAVVRLLLEAGANADVRDDRGRTPLHWASDADVATVLINAGANVSARDQDGRVAWPP